MKRKYLALAAIAGLMAMISLDSYARGPHEHDHNPAYCRRFPIFCQ